MSRKNINTRKALKEGKSWGEFDQFENTDKYLLPQGEGDNKGTQAAAAMCKLVYKWFNDGDVFDTNYALKGWANDLSSYANWIYAYVEGTSDILNRIKTIKEEGEYEDLLFDLISVVDPQIPELLKEPKVDSIYDCEGPYSFYEAPTCPYCGQEADEWDISHYGMCMDCWDEQNLEHCPDCGCSENEGYDKYEGKCSNCGYGEEDEDEDDDLEESKHSRARRIRESEEDVPHMTFDFTGAPGYMGDGLVTVETDSEVSITWPDGTKRSIVVSLDKPGEIEVL